MKSKVFDVSVGKETMLTSEIGKGAGGENLEDELRLDSLVLKCIWEPNEAYTIDEWMSESTVQGRDKC